MDADQRIINYFQQRKFENINKILEFGCGRGYFTKILRQVFPESKITGFDLKENRSKKVKSILDNGHWFDITEKKIEKEKEIYDMVLMGGLARPLWWHFGIHREDKYRNILSNLNYYLKHNGIFILVFETYDYYTNLAEKNYNDMRNFSCGDLSRDFYLDERLRSDILGLTKDILNTIDNFTIESIIIKDDEDAPEKGFKSCLNLAKDKLKSTYLNQQGIDWMKKTRAEAIQLFKNITDENLRDLMEQNTELLNEAKTIDKSIEKHGIEYSNFTVVIARKLI